MGLGATAGVAAVGGFALSARADESTSKSTTASDALVFDQDDYTELTTTTSTDDGDKEVKYHFYKAIT